MNLFPDLGFESIEVESYLPSPSSSKKDICSLPHRDRGNKALADLRELANFIWSGADIPRGPYRPNQCMDVFKDKVFRSRIRRDMTSILGTWPVNVVK